MKKKKKVNNLPKKVNIPEIEKVELSSKKEKKQIPTSKKIINKLKKWYCISYDFILKYKFYFILGLASLIILLTLLLFTKWYIALSIGIGTAAIGILIYYLVKRGVFVKKNTKKRTTKNSSKITKIKTSKKKEPLFKKILRYLLIIFCFFFLIGLIGAGAFFIYIATTSDKFDANKLYRSEATILYDKDGVEFARIGAQNREKITFDELPEVLVDAIIATEDSRFFQHNGVDIPRFAKASIGQVLGRNAGGASTITMQVSKNSFTDPTLASGIKGIIRKFRDIYISVFQIEKNYTKQEIIEFYVNDSNLGADAWGVEQASKAYFGKSAKDLNLTEAALIAGLFQAPNALNPYRNPEGASERRGTVLYLMEIHGYITHEERMLADSIPVKSLLLENSVAGARYQAFIDTVVDEIMDLKLGNAYYTPMEIYTTMDRTRQDAVNSIFDGTKFKWENEAVQAGAAVVDVNTGAIVAVGAGRNRVGKLTFNYATDTNRQIGSTAKPLFEYGPGIEYNNWSTYYPFVDEQYFYSSGAEMNNWDGGYKGFITLREALKQSRNVPALKAFKSLNNKNIYEFVTNLGLHPELEQNNTYVHEAHAVGAYNGESPLSMATAYAAFANGGYYNSPHSFTKIVYRDTEETYETKVTTRKAMSSQTAYMITSILTDTAPYALGTYGYIPGVTFCAKTGTTNFNNTTFTTYKLASNAVNDLWVAGYSPEYSIAVWYGYPEMNKDYASKKQYNRFGSAQNARVWNAIAKNVFTKGKSFTISSNGVEKIAVEKETYPAQLPSEYTPKSYITYELFKSGTGPTTTSTRFTRLPDVTNLNVNTILGKASLTWTPIDTPTLISEEYWTEYYKGIYKSEKDQTKYLESHMTMTKEKIGDIIYQIYMKNSDGEFVNIGSTKSTTFEYAASGNVTFMVKTAYEFYTTSYEIDNSSPGVEISANLIPNLITASINGSENISLNIGEQYTESGVTVYVNGIALDTTKYNVVKKIYDINNLDTPIDSIDTSKASKYKIKYEITYETYSNVLIRNIEIKEA